MPANQSQRSQRTVARLLLACCAALAAIAVTALALLWSGRNSARELRSRLLAEAELQSELMASQPSDQSVYPHLEQEIGFVLNPFMKRSTWKGPDDGLPYRINSLGLRGEAIRAKRAGALRIVLVGDSYFFGWRLADHDRLGEQMSALLRQRLPTVDIDVLTVAVPGWSVASAASFLEHHLDLLEPDVVVWKLLRNDIEDVPGVAPPGILATWNSPARAEGQAAVRIATDFHKDLAMPAVLERWDANLGKIARIRDWGVPVLLVGLNAHRRTLFELLRERSSSDLSALQVPASFTDDRRLWCVAPPDCHPSAEANRILSLGLLDRLGRLGIVPTVDFEEEELPVVEAFRSEEERPVTAAEIESFRAAQMNRVPTSFKPGEEKARACVFYGLEPVSGRISENGVMFLRAGAGSTVLELDIEAPANPFGRRRSGHFVVRNERGERTERSIEIPAGPVAVRLTLPPARGQGVYELAWRFDFANCDNPVRCASGTLKSARFGR